MGYDERFTRFGRWAWFGLLFLQPFGQFGALRQLSQLILLVCLAGLLSRASAWRALCAGERGFWRLAMVLLCWIVGVSLAGPYPLDSLDEMRKGLLPQVLLFLAPLVLTRGTGDRGRMLIGLLAGFGLVTLLSLTEVVPYLLTQGGFQTMSHIHDSWTGGYGSTGSLYVPLLFAALMLPGLALAWRRTGWALLLLALALVALYSSRTAIIVIIAGISVFMMLDRRRQVLVSGVLAIACLLTFSLAVSVPPPAGEPASVSAENPYQRLLVPQTYVTNQGLSSRGDVWRGVLQLIEARPITGYGFGWKKLAWVINEQGFADQWQATEPGLASYFLVQGKAVYGRVNPHNYYLQVWFEIGGIGLALVLGFWGRLAGRAVALLRAATDQGHRSWAALCLSVLVAYFVANLTNGHWVGGLANLALTLGASLLLGRRDDQGADSAS